MTTSAFPPALLSSSEPLAEPLAAPVAVRAHAAAASAPPAPNGSAALARFTVAGLRATLDSHTAGRLGLARLCWELSVRLEQLDTLRVRTSALTRLRWRLRTLERLHAEFGDQAPFPEQRHAVADLRVVLAGLVRDVQTRDVQTRDG